MSSLFTSKYQVSRKLPLLVMAVVVVEEVVRDSVVVGPGAGRALAV